MIAPEPSFIEVSGARLYYESYGSGPLVIMVPGAASCSEPYRMLAAELADCHKAVAYDRRGFSRSILTTDQDYEHRLDTDADDVAALIGHLNDGPAIVFGNSSGAIVALHTLVRHPSALRKAIAHEPPLMRELVEGDEWVQFFSSLYELYRSSGPGPALERFRDRSFPASDRQVMAHASTNGFTEANSKYWLEHELRQYPTVTCDHESLRRLADQLILAVGEEARGFPCYEATVALGRSVGSDPIELPGGHVGFIAHPDAFANALRAQLGRSCSDD